MRSVVLTRLPRLSERIYRASTSEDPDAVAPSPFVSPDTKVVPNEDTGRMEWSWPDAEKRLTTAFEHGGFSGWAAGVLQELEAEGEIERKKRGHS